MGRYDPWMELERISELQWRAMRNEDDDTLQACEMAKDRIAREIRAANLHRHDEDEPETRRRDSTIDHDMQIVAALEERPMYAHQLAARLGEEEYTLSNILRRLRRQGYVTKYGGKWKAVPYDV